MLHFGDPERAAQQYRDRPALGAHLLMRPTNSPVRVSTLKAIAARIPRVPRPARVSAVESPDGCAAGPRAKFLVLSSARSG